MVASFTALKKSVIENTLREKPVVHGNPQLPLYRHAVPGTGALTYLYLGVASKHDTYKDAAHADRLDVASDAAALAAIDDVLRKTFFEPWTAGAIDELEPTKISRTCLYCDFKRVCPGYLEEDE